MKDLVSISWATGTWTAAGREPRLKKAAKSVVSNDVSAANDSLTRCGSVLFHRGEKRAILAAKRKLSLFRRRLFLVSPSTCRWLLLSSFPLSLGSLFPSTQPHHPVSSHPRFGCEKFCAARTTHDCIVLNIPLCFLRSFRPLGGSHAAALNASRGKRREIDPE